MSCSTEIVEPLQSLIEANSVSDLAARRIATGEGVWTVATQIVRGLKSILLAVTGSGTTGSGGGNGSGGSSSPHTLSAEAKTELSIHARQLQAVTPLLLKTSAGTSGQATADIKSSAGSGVAAESITNGEFDEIVIACLPGETDASKFWRTAFGARVVRYSLSLCLTAAAVID